MESKAIEMQMSFRNCCCCDVGGGGGWIQRRGLIPIVGCSLHRTDFIFYGISINPFKQHTHSRLSRVSPGRPTYPVHVIRTEHRSR